MEDILVNYFCHIRKNISEKIGEQLLTDLDSIHVKTEKDLHNRVSKYIEELSQDDLQKIAIQIYQSYIRQDDEKIIKTSKFLLKKYEFYHNFKMRSYLYKWRENCIKITIRNHLHKISVDEEEDKTKHLSIELGKNFSEENSILKAYYKAKDRNSNVKVPGSRTINVPNSETSDYKVNYKEKEREKSRSPNNINSKNMLKYNTEENSFMKIQKEFLQSQNELNKLEYDYSMYDNENVSYDQNEKTVIEPTYKENINQSQEIRQDKKSEPIQFNYQYEKSNLQNSNSSIQNNSNLKQNQHKNNNINTQTQKNRYNVKYNYNQISERNDKNERYNQIEVDDLKYSDLNEINQEDLHLSDYQKYSNIKQAERQNEVFNRLYIDSYKKNDNIAYNQEIGKVKKNNNCSFFPNTNK